MKSKASTGRTAASTSDAGKAGSGRGGSRKAGRSSVFGWLIPVAVVVVAAVLIGYVIMQNGSDDADPAASAADPAAEFSHDVGLERRDADDPLAIGRVDAPITLIVFTDYQCPYCAKWSHDTLPTMMERAEKGELRIEMRDVNVFGEASRRAARASYAAALQGKFLEYHHGLYPDGKTRKGPGLSDDALIGLAGELGLDTARFRTDMDSAATESAITENEDLGLGAGAFSTPSFILGGQPIRGAQPTDVFVKMLDRLLADESR